jgi:NAD+ kinase
MTYVVGVAVHPTRPVAASVREIVAWARTAGSRVVGRTGDRDRLVEGVTCLADEVFAERVNGVVALGGDGTMLGAMRLVARRPVPVLGVNHGHLGFLVEIDPSGLGDALGRLASGRFTLETHPALRARCGGRDGGTESGDTGPGDTAFGDTGFGDTAFNDVVLIRTGTTGSISVDLTVNGARYGYYRADAVVVATPSGSTAYNYGAGGPVLSPSASASVVTPVAPISGIARSVVLDGSDVITLSPADEPVELQVDGVPTGTVAPGEAVEVTMVREAASVVRLDARAHAERNRVVLSLRDLPLRPDQLLELVPAPMRARLPRRHE